mgnify:FL=1
MFWMNDWNRGMGPRGPMHGGHGPMAGPRRDLYGRRPMRFGYHRPMMGMGGLFILPALMFGGWIVVAVLGRILGLVGTIIGGVFEGLGALAEGAFSGNGLVLGIVIGLALYFWMKKRNTARTEEEE